jgi:hypothetical protein
VHSGTRHPRRAAGFERALFRDEGAVAGGSGVNFRMFYGLALVEYTLSAIESIAVWWLVFLIL